MKIESGIISGGEWYRNADGTIVFQNLILTPIPEFKSEHVEEKRLMLSDIWISSTFKYDQFIKHLDQNGLYDTHENKLSLKARQVRALYHLLQKNNIVEDHNMKMIYEIFSRTFRLKFHNERSLQTDFLDSDVEHFKNIFSFFRFV